MANITGRGEEVGRLICRGGQVENGEVVASAVNAQELGDVSVEDTILDFQIKSPVSAVIAISSNNPPKYFVSSYKEPDVLRTRHLLPYACSRVAIEPS